MRKEKGIPISQKHGVNPSLEICLICGESTSVLLLGKLKGDAEAPSRMAAQAPCHKCEQELEEHKSKGMVVIVVNDEVDEHPKHSPWKFFHSYHVIKHEAFDRMFKKIDKSKGMCFMHLSLAKKMGLVK